MLGKVKEKVCYCGGQQKVIQLSVLIFFGPEEKEGVWFDGMIPTGASFQFEQSALPTPWKVPDRRGSNLQPCMRSGDVSWCVFLKCPHPRETNGSFVVFYYQYEMWLTDLAVECLQALMYTPIHLAAVNGHLEAVQLLTDAGALLNKTDTELMTPLHRWEMTTARN